MNNVLNIITRCTRPGNLITVRDSVFNNIPGELTINWHVLFDTAPLKDIDAELLSSISNSNTTIHFTYGGDGGLLYPQSSELIKTFDTNSWFYFLDDDNIIHEDFYSYLIDNELLTQTDHQIHVVSQHVDGKDFTGLNIREARADNVGLQKTDIAQLVIASDVVINQGFEFGANYKADGYFTEAVYKKSPDTFLFHNIVLSHYNYLEKKASPKVPRVIYIGNDKPELKSILHLSYESDELITLYLENDNDIIKNIIDFKPDCIVTSGEDWAVHENLSSLPEQFRRKWINLNGKDLEHVGEIAYNSLMNTMLSEDTLGDQNMISFFTPIYNTGDKLWKTYQSVAKQTYSNWEWVLVNDSTDGGKTLKIAEEIAANDPRVKVFDFREKSGGCIGEVKWRCCTMSRGYILAELDHDDLIVEDVAEYLHKAAQKHPEAGFFFGDTCELRDDGNSNVYGKGFALDYGTYRDVEYNGKTLKVVNQPDMNPKTVRHIVGVPNHIRAWRRSTYFEVGGHNRELTVADDYELLVRTWLKSRYCKIPKLTYLQFLYDSGASRNTHDLSRADIQRRVRTIASHYNEQIKARFEELGLKDWAYEENSLHPTWARSRFGEEENGTVITYIEDENTVRI